MNNEYMYFYTSPFGKIGIVEKGQKISRLFFYSSVSNTNEIMLQKTPLLKDAVSQLNAYFHGQLKSFDLPLDLQGTDFQLQVWNTLCKIPFGKTCTYKEIAIQVGNAGASRAVGQANHRNCIPIIVPCHRVIQSTGKLGGYAYGLSMKQSLLDLEKNA